MENIPSQFDIEAPIVIDPDPSQWYDLLKAAWETYTGKVFPTEGPEVDLLNTMAQMVSLNSNNLNYTMAQNFANFSKGDILDNLCSTYGITRLASVGAKTTIQFVTQDSTPITVRDSVIRAGTSVETGDGAAFVTDEAVTMEVGATTVSVTATAVTAGVGGNNIQIGEINAITDPSTISNPLIANGTVSNTEITSGGGDTEGDERLRRRLFLALEAKSTAGSKGMYEFWALSYSANIVSAYADATPDSGVADIYVIEEGGVAPSSATLQAIKDLISPDEKRPMCDQVNVYAGEEYAYTVEYTVDYYPSAAPYIDDQITEAIRRAEELDAVNQNILGRDIIPNEYVRLTLNLQGVYDVNITTPVATSIGPHQFGKMSGSPNITKGVERE